MTSIPKVVDVASASGARRERWVAVREVLGGALLLAAWVALWTVTWAAVAGPLSPAEPARLEAAASLTRS